MQILKDLKEAEQLQNSNVTKSDSKHMDDFLDKNKSTYLKRSRSDPGGGEFQKKSIILPDIDDQMIHVSPTTRSNECESINILLLGETGVGKSTFINAFANYLTFNTLQQAKTGQPVVLIPVSFLITVGDNFDEQTIKFGDVDDSNNEDFEHPGQSVTQHCRSYVFNIDRDRGKKLCIIDTPGFGDTRGINQDDFNMAHILEYIKGLSHLNAICFLLKPNESRLNIFYRSCLTQFSSFQKSSSCNNILFCFTNARSTFYTPGDTAPLLKKTLTSLSQSAVPFKKDNTFCFDSESFRYLVALQNGISFDDLQKEEYEMSWTKSVTEANRLVHYICEILFPIVPSK
jgi:GTPase SAR1 family protein